MLSVGSSAREAQLRDLGLERLDDVRVELRPGAALELAQRVRRGKAAPVDAVGRHRVVGVGDEEDPRAERDLLAGEAVRVAGAVPALVVVEHPGRDGLDAERVEHAEADLGVPLEHEPLRS